MAGLVTLLQNISNLDAQDIFFKTLNDAEVRAFIASLNTSVQLFEEGIDATGKRLDQIKGPYAPSTVAKKRREGLPVDRVTLFDTGRFYESWRVIIGSDLTITIEADSDVRAGYDLQEDYGFNIVGLTDESLEQLKEFIFPRFIQNLKQAITRGV